MSEVSENASPKDVKPADGAKSDNVKTDGAKSLSEDQRNELRKKMKSNRQAQIAQRKKKSSQKSKPLTPIYYCDAADCLTIMSETEVKTCPICRSFHYCSKECQVKNWTTHKSLCGKNVTEESKAKLVLYHKASDAAEELYQFFKEGNYITVMHEALPAPASIFASLAEEKTNVLHYRMYLKQNLFTTSNLSGFGNLAPKIQASMDAYSDKQIYVITLIFDRLKNQGNTDAVVRLFIANEIGEQMAAPSIDGKISKQVIKYKRK